MQESARGFVFQSLSLLSLLHFLSWSDLTKKVSKDVNRTVKLIQIAQLEWSKLTLVSLVSEIICTASLLRGDTLDSVGFLPLTVTFDCVWSVWKGSSKSLHTLPRHRNCDVRWCISLQEVLHCYTVACFCSRFLPWHLQWATFPKILHHGLDKSGRVWEDWHYGRNQDWSEVSLCPIERRQKMMRWLRGLRGLRGFWMLLVLALSLDELQQSCSHPQDKEQEDKE